MKYHLRAGEEYPTLMAAWGRVDEAMVEPVRPRIPAHIANWLIALIIALPLAWLLGDFSFRYHWNVGTYLPFSRRPLELLGLWLVCYWGVVAVRHLLKQHGANPP